MSKVINNDARLIRAIRNGGQERLNALRSIFQDDAKRLKVIRYLTSKGCTREDAEDLYQDAIIIFDRKVVVGDFMELSSIENYIFGIAKLNWFNKFRSYQKRESETVIDEFEVEADVSYYYERNERAEILKQVVNLLGEKCRKLLMLFAHGYSIDAIAKELNFVNKTRATKEKYRCLNRLRQKMRRNSSLANYVKSELTPE